MDKYTFSRFKFKAELFLKRPYYMILRYNNNRKAKAWTEEKRKSIPEGYTLTHDQLSYYSCEMMRASNKILRESDDLTRQDYMVFKGPLAIEVYNYCFKEKYPHYWYSPLVVLRDDRLFNESTIELVKVGTNSKLAYFLNGKEYTYKQFEKARKKYWDSPSSPKVIEIPEVKHVPTKRKKPDIIKTIIVDGIMDWDHKSPNEVYAHKGTHIVRAY